jgi:hypothetical protein
MEYLRVKNWDRYQHYKERKPPWIKLYVSLLCSPNVDTLSDVGKYHLIAIMALASQHDNLIPFNKGWITRVIHANSRINWDALLSCDMIECVHDASTTLSSCKHDASPRARSRETETETETETPISPSRGFDGFEEFWKIYPRRTAKSAALKAWNKLKPDSELQNKIKAAVERQTRFPGWMKDDGQFIPHAATYLNGRRWEDEVQTETSLPADEPGADPQFRLVTAEDGRRVAVKR